jgi:hypothetical protein
MAGHDCSRTCHGEPQAIDARIDADNGNIQGRQQRCRHPAFAYVDQHHPEREAESLRAQRVGAAGIPAPHRADVHAAAEAADDETPNEGPQEIRKQRFDAEFQHGARL